MSIKIRPDSTKPVLLYWKSPRRSNSRYIRWAPYSLKRTMTGALGWGGINEVKNNRNAMNRNWSQIPPLKQTREINKDTNKQTRGPLVL